MSWTLEQLQPFIDRLGNPVVVTHKEVLVAVNHAFTESLGLSREKLIGTHYQKLIPAEELAPLAEYSRRREHGEAPAVMVLRANALDGQGNRRPWIIHVTELPSDLGEPYILASCAEVPEAVRDLTLAERVVQLAATLASERSEDRVRAAVIAGFQSFGVTASLSRIESATRATLLEASEGAPEPDLQIFHEAVESRRPVFLLPPGTNTYTVYIPVIRSDGAHELLILWSSPFETLHLSLLTLFARQLAATLENTRHMAELGQRNHELMLLLELARTTTAATLDLNTILEVACDFVTRLLDVSNCFILLLDPAQKQLQAVAASATARGVLGKISMALDSGSIAARAARERRPQMIEDVSNTAEPVRRDLVELLGEKALLAVPMTARTELIGAIVVDDTRGPRRFSPELISLAEATASQLALSVQSAKLYESLKDSYAQLDRTRAEMVKQERLAALGELSAIVAHEVRNPLGVIFNAVASLRRVMNQDADAAMLLEIVKEECERLNRIVSDLLDFSRPMGLLLEEEDLSSLINESISAALAGAGSDVDWKVETSIEAQLPRAVVDRQALRQALVNVLINALQAMPRGGTVTVRTSRENGGVRIDVQDEGTGIPPDIRARVFEPFFTTKAKGTGLGLAVVKRILEDHRGEVLLASEPGRGTTFTFKLPLTNASEKATQSP